MATYTSKYNLKKPAPSDFADVADLNNNMDIVDEALNDKANLTYCTCGTSTSTSAKVATVTAGVFELKTGVAVDVKFTYSNTASAPTLNVNGTGAKSIKKYGTTAPSAYMWQASAIVQFVYDGTYWVMQNGTTATTTYYGVTKLNSSVSSTSTTEAATPSAVKQAYDKANTAIPSTQKASANGVASLDAEGKIPSAQLPDIAGKRTCRFVVGTSTAGWTEADVDYLCDGAADDVEINAAIQALPSTGGEIVILDGTYNLDAPIGFVKNNFIFRGSGATVLKRAYARNAEFSLRGMIAFSYCNNVIIKNLIFDRTDDADAEISDNTYTQGGYAIYAISSSNVKILNNQIKNQQRGICLHNTHFSEVTGNSCTNIITSCISVSSGKYNIVSENHIHDATRAYAIDVTTTSKYITVAGNICSDCAYGIRYSGNPTGAIIANNIVYNISNDGIKTENTVNSTIEDSGASIIGNTCTDCGLSICVRNERFVNVIGNICLNKSGLVYSNSVVKIDSASHILFSGNTCIRKTGTANDYNQYQYPIEVNGDYNLIVGNIFAGKTYLSSGTGNIFENNQIN